MDTTKKFVITINREIGSGGGSIGRELAKRLGVDFVDKAIVETLTKKFDLSVEEIEKLKAEKFNWWNEVANTYVNRYYMSERFDLDTIVPTTENIFKVESQVLREIAAQGSCVIAGRSGFYIFRDEPNSVKIFIQSTKEKRLAHIMEKRNVSSDKAEKIIQKVDEGRENYTKKFSGTSRYDTRNYDLAINVANMTTDEAVDLILKFIEMKK
ncbi:MAG: AAA family ATPase [Phocaeicola sp.]|uniref:cytidylate kinase-like family protein n=1 Tax=Phocaeicola TaxID=909656 RepID=UPI00234F3117|nr:cytidylate kinase-like family protein [Phocaeicola oris]MCE2617147.1 cytidylate kinase-like family protein [Phocaeicola oris]